MRHLLGSPLHFHNPDPKISCNPVLRRVLSITKIPPDFALKSRIPSFKKSKIPKNLMGALTYLASPTLDKWNSEEFLFPWLSLCLLTVNL